METDAYSFYVLAEFDASHKHLFSRADAILAKNLRLLKEYNATKLIEKFTDMSFQ